MAYNTLYDYFSSQGKALPSYNSSERLALASQAGISSGYVGSAEQNTQIVNYLNKKPAPAGQMQPTQTPSTPAVGGFTMSPSANIAPPLDMSTKTTTPAMYPTAEERAAIEKAAQTAKLAAQEETRKAQVKSQAESLKSSGAGSNAINQFLGGLNATDKAMVSGMFGSNATGTAPTASNVQKTTITGSGITTTGARSPEIQANIDAINASIKGLQGEASKYGITLSEIGTPSDIGGTITAPKTDTETNLPELPVTGGSATTNLTESLAAKLDITKKTLETKYKTQIDELNKQIEASQKKVDDLNTLKIEGAISNIKDLSAPFQNALEEAERNRLYINKNFEANQKLTDELDSLLTEGNTLIAEQRAVTGLSSIRDPRIAKTMTDVSARAGVIEAVINARNGQISQAYTMIDRTVEAMTNDKNKQIDYYNTLLEYYGNLKTEEKSKLTTLTTEKKAIIEKQVAILENEVNTAEETAKVIKDAMLDPDTALTFASAGITLNDTMEKITAKLAQYGYAQEIKETSEKMALDGASYLAPGQSVPAGSQTFTTTDSLGKTKTWYKPGTKASTSDPLKKVDYSNAETFVEDNPNASYSDLYNGILQNTKLTTTEANALLASKNITPTKATKAEVYLSPENVKLVANGLIDAYGREGALESIKTTGKVTVNDKEITLSQDQIDAITSSISSTPAEEEKSWWEFWK